MIDFQKQTARSGKKAVTLTTQEFKILSTWRSAKARSSRGTNCCSGVGLRHPGDPHQVSGSSYLSTSSEHERDPHQPVFVRTAHRDGYCLTQGY